MVIQYAHHGNTKFSLVWTLALVHPNIAWIRLDHMVLQMVIAQQLPAFRSTTFWSFEMQLLHTPSVLIWSSYNKIKGVHEWYVYSYNKIKGVHEWYVYSQLEPIVSLVAYLAGSFVDASQREIKVLLDLCVTQLCAYQTWTEGVFENHESLSPPSVC
jgi:hypothetical protein